MRCGVLHLVSYTTGGATGEWVDEWGVDWAGVMLPGCVGWGGCSGGFWNLAARVRGGNWSVPIAWGMSRKTDSPTDAPL